jgi:hypothetical protein
MDTRSVSKSALEEQDIGSCAQSVMRLNEGMLSYVQLYRTFNGLKDQIPLDMLAFERERRGLRKMGLQMLDRGEDIYSKLEKAPREGKWQLLHETKGHYTAFRRFLEHELSEGLLK